MQLYFSKLYRLTLLPWFDYFQVTTPPLLRAHCPFTRVLLLAASRTSTRPSAYFAQPPRKRSRKHTTRSASHTFTAPSWITNPHSSKQCVLLSLRWPKSITLTPTKKTHKPRRSLLSWLKLTRFRTFVQMFPRHL